jgi:uncharacterized protein (DUF362 family)
VSLANDKARIRRLDPYTSEGRALVSKVQSTHNLKQDIATAVSAIGGFGKVVAPGSTVLVKPNFNTTAPPPAASDPQFVATLVELLREHGAGSVVVGESSMTGTSTRRTLQQAGMLQVARKVGASVVVFEEDEWRRVETGGTFLRRVSLARAGLEAATIVYACCLKTHRFADFTMSLKMAMGFVRPRDRLGMHLSHLREKLVDINLIIKPDLILLDGRRCFISGGPSSGTIREPNLVLASGDRVALDVEGLKVISSYPDSDISGDPWKLPMIQQAVKLDLGAKSDADYRLIEG